MAETALVGDYGPATEVAGLIAGRAQLAERLPQEALLGDVSRAGIPKTFRPAA